MFLSQGLTTAAIHKEKIVSPLKGNKHADEHYDSQDRHYDWNTNQLRRLITWNTTAWSPSEMLLLKNISKRNLYSLCWVSDVDDKCSFYLLLTSPFCCVKIRFFCSFHFLCLHSFQKQCANMLKLCCDLVSLWLVKSPILLYLIDYLCSWTFTVTPTKSPNKLLLNDS